MSYHGDFVIGSTFDFKFTSMDAGIPTSISGGHIAAYPDNSTTEILAGITFTPDFDSRTGLNNVRIVMTIGNGYASGSNYDLVLISGTIGGKNAVGYAVGSFSISARNTGGASDPWATYLISGSYAPSQAGGVLMSRMPSGTVVVGQNNDKTGYSLASPQSYDRIGNTSGTLTNVLNVVNPVTAGVVTGSVLGNVNGSVNNVVQPVGINTGTFIGAIADGVWDENFMEHLLINSTGERLASRMPSGTVIVGSNLDKTGYSLSTPQNFNLNGNISGTLTNVLNVVNPIPSVGIVTGAVVVATNNDKTGYALTSTEHTNIADALLKRDWNSVTGEAARSVLNALRKLRNKVSFNGSNTLTVTEEDDATTAYTQSITTDANQNPFKEVG